MKSRIYRIILEILIGNIEGVIEDSKQLLKMTGAAEVDFLWNDTRVIVHPYDNPQDILEKYYADRGM